MMCSPKGFKRDYDDDVDEDDNADEHDDDRNHDGDGSVGH